MLYLKLLLQLLGYTSSIPGMSGGVISPTNLSLYSTGANGGVSPAIGHRGPPPGSATRSRWNPSFLSMEDDFNMMSHALSGSNPAEATSVILMEDCKLLHYFHLIETSPII